MQHIRNSNHSDLVSLVEKSCHVGQVSIISNFADIRNERNWFDSVTYFRYRFITFIGLKLVNGPYFLAFTQKGLMLHPIVSGWFARTTQPNNHNKIFLNALNFLLALIEGSP